jgi:gamma-glutamylcyclotransferase (GGCT)/AIG2-like uncharacterized protein YtfP
MRGTCLCGAIEYEADQLDSPIEHCSCRTCRKAHAAAFNSAAAVCHEHFRWIRGQELLRGYASSPGKNRWFCSRCGSHLVAQVEGREYLILRVATLDDDPGQSPAMQIWASHEVPWLKYGPHVAAYPEWEPGHQSAYVFVYGTLKEGFPNSTINTGTRLPGLFVTAERFPFYLVGERHSPWLIHQPGQGEQVIGQVFEVGPAVFERMDALERVHEPDGYRRVQVEVRQQGEDGAGPLSVFAYLKDPDALPGADIRQGPLAEYTLEHAVLYQKRN